MRVRTVAHVTGKHFKRRPEGLQTALSVGSSVSICSTWC
jgi:hypothetical protein